MGGLGIKHFGDVVKPTEALDIIPVDLVTNSILIATSYSEMLNKGDHFIFHQASSQNNPISLLKYSDVTTAVYDKIKLDKN